MKRSRLIAVGGFFLAALLSSPAWGSVPPQPGTINYIEGNADVGAHAVTDKSVGSARLAAGQSLSTENGRAEILLTPGIFLRVDNHSTVQMISPGLADTISTVQKGRAMVEVDEIRPENNVRINEHGASTQLLKAGLYSFDADQGVVRVFDGEALVQVPGRNIELKSGRELVLNASGKLKARKFDKKQDMGDFYRWASLRSAYLAEANVDAARTYVGATGFAPDWYGYGWYWDPWFDAYTFIPGDGIFFGPFGWGFYSPWYALGAPYFGFGYGYGGFGYGGGYYHRFGPGFHAPYAARGGASGYMGHAYHVSGFTHSFARSGGFGGRAFGGGGFRGGFGGSGRAFSGGGFRGGFGGGGGFHGGGGGGHR
ncbi:MAG: hypothetical protein WAJ87_01300 [Bryobacteraceae bacterium]